MNNVQVGDSVICTTSTEEGRRIVTSIGENICNYRFMPTMHMRSCPWEEIEIDTRWPKMDDSEIDIMQGYV